MEFMFHSKEKNCGIKKKVLVIMLSRHLLKGL